jgi:hypothetical protein
MAKLADSQLAGLLGARLPMGHQLMKKRFAERDSF